MLAVHDYMVNQGVINDEDKHTRIPGIWEKVGTLYNLPMLDEREDSIMNDPPDDNGEPVELYSPFSLPEDEYGDLMFAKRLDPDGSSSPAYAASVRESTVAEIDGPGSSPAPGRRSGRTVRTPARGRRVSEMQNDESIDEENTRPRKVARKAQAKRGRGGSYARRAARRR